MGTAGIVLLSFSMLMMTRLSRCSGDEPRRSTFSVSNSQGAILSVVSLKSDESITVTQIKKWPHGDTFASRYYIVGGAERKIVRAQLEVSMDMFSGCITSHSNQEAEVIIIDSRQQKGLDIYMRYLRNNERVTGNSYATYEVDYFKQGRKIGQERFIDELHSRVPWCDRYEGLPEAVRIWLTVEEYGKLVTFESIMSQSENEANQSLEPTTTSVTPAADAPVAPAAVVAHL